MWIHIPKRIIFRAISTTLLISIALLTNPLETLASNSTAGQIAFSSNRDGNYEIYLMGSDGGGVQQLTDTSRCNNTYPAWSPDGTEIAFHSNCNGDFNVFIVNADGSNLHQVTFGAGANEFPAWSPDGTKIAFSNKIDDLYDVWVMNADGSNAHNLTNSPSNDWGSSWSPDGTQIAFDSNRDGSPEVYVMSADGGIPRRITNTQLINDRYMATPLSLPAWSPDGRSIAIGSLYSDGFPHIYLANSQSGELTEVGPKRAAAPIAGSLSWSPDGSQLVYSQIKYDGMSAGDIYILTVATHTIQQLTTSNNSITPVWSPIGNTSTIASSPNNASSAQVTSANSLCHPSGYCVDIPIGWEGQFDPRPNNLILSHENLRIAVELTHFEGLDQMSAPEIQNTRIGLNIQAMGAMPTGSPQQVRYAGYSGIQQHLQVNGETGSLVSLIIANNVEAFITGLRLQGAWDERDDAWLANIANSLTVSPSLDVSQLDG